MDIYAIIALFLNYSHIIFGVIVLVLICMKFPKKVKEIDPNWLYNNIGDIIGRSFAIGGFITLCIGFGVLAIMGSWPSDYIKPTTIATSIFIVVIYLLVLAYHQWNTWAIDIEKKYGIPQPSDESKDDKDESK